MARSTRTQMQAVPPRGHEALPEGRALPDREVRGRAAQLSARRARPRAHQAVGVPAPAAREAEGAPLLRHPREAVPQLLREGGQGAPGSRARRSCACSRLRLDNVVYRLGFAASRAQARQIIRHGHFQVNGRRVNIPSYQVRPERRRLPEGRKPGRAGRPRRHGPDRFGRALAPGRPRQPDRQGSEAARARRHRHARPGAAHRRALFSRASNSPGTKKEGPWLHEPLSWNSRCRGSRTRRSTRTAASSSSSLSIVASATRSATRCAACSSRLSRAPPSPR